MNKILTEKFTNSHSTTQLESPDCRSDRPA